ncbi:MAG TPA: MBL fold metallo-hydrolase [Myxococcales bacterium]|jgi:glyoxylase-like metal-dependent hydrolase (beta-lactamase superfamily II)|nr:MBL fold metallo-hydrolase [Myxococcales bacterium]
MAFRAGRFTLHSVLDGFYRLDGGSMFGIVPRAVWAGEHPPDEQNRIELALRCLLVDTGERKVLVDTGIGDKLAKAEQVLFAVDRSRYNLDAELARAGVSREQITDVVLTHLHFDHAGGTTIRRPDGRMELAFPNASYHLQRRHWKWAHHPTDRDRSFFIDENFLLLEQSGRLHLVEGECELCEGVHLLVSEGHTVGGQLVRVESEGVQVIFCGDLVPTRAHLAPSFQMAFDLHPLTMLEEKRMLLAQALEDEAILFLQHDPKVAALRVREVDGLIVAGDTVAF